MKKINVGVVGATGMVGMQFLRVLAEKNLNIDKLYLFASARTAGRTLWFGEQQLTVEVLSEESFDRPMDYAFFCAGGAISQAYAPFAASKGVVVIDNSSYFRMDPQVPLIVPEVNPEAMRNHRNIIANPNCSTIQAAVVLGPLHQAYGLKRVVISTYQAVSGAGKAGIVDLLTGQQKLRWQTQRLQDALADPDHEKNPIDLLRPWQAYRLQTMTDYIAGNVIPAIGEVDGETGYTIEERKLMNETKKILAAPELKVSATAVRVPVINGHSESLNIELAKPFSLPELKDILRHAPGISLLADNPTPLKASGQDGVLVGRVRADTSCNAIDVFTSADNLRKGAASNGVHILALLVSQSAHSAK